VLIDFGADVNNQERVKGVSPLMRAADFGRVECMRLLLDKKADVALTTNESWTGIHYACCKGNASVCAYSSRTMLMWTARTSMATQDLFLLRIKVTLSV
jgi:ankyrin repeat protein